MTHKPVLLREVTKIFDPRPGEYYIDATINGGGHSKAIMEKISPEGSLLGIDWDCGLIQAAKIQFSKSSFQNTKIILECDNYANIKHIAGKYNFSEVSGILFDLGFSSYHVEESKKGFSFLRDEPLDMRYSLKNNETAEKIINDGSEKTIENILREYGEERFSASIARGIVEARKKKRIARTSELIRVIRESVPRAYLTNRMHFATKTFQALRIAVNKELDNLKTALEDSLDILAPSGKIIVISFHSLEDRIVKNFFKNKFQEGRIDILTNKPVIASFDEIKENPRSRSAKLRACENLSQK